MLQIVFFILPITTRGNILPITTRGNVSVCPLSRRVYDFLPRPTYSCKIHTQIDLWTYFHIRTHEKNASILFSLSPREEMCPFVVFYSPYHPREEMCPFVLFPGESMTFCHVPHIRVKYTPRLIYGPISTSVHTRKMRVFYSPYHHERKCVRLQYFILPITPRGNVSVCPLSRRVYGFLRCPMYSCKIHTRIDLRVYFHGFSYQFSKSGGT